MLSPEIVAHFEQEGYVILPGLFSEEEVDFYIQPRRS